MWKIEKSFSSPFAHEVSVSEQSQQAADQERSLQKICAKAQAKLIRQASKIKTDSYVCVHKATIAKDENVITFKLSSSAPYIQSHETRGQFQDNLQDRLEKLSLPDGRKVVSAMQMSERYENPWGGFRAVQHLWFVRIGDKHAQPAAEDTDYSFSPFIEETPRVKHK